MNMASQDGESCAWTSGVLNHRIERTKHLGCRSPSLVRKGTCGGRRMVMHMTEERSIHTCNSVEGCVGIQIVDISDNYAGE